MDEERKVVHKYQLGLSDRQEVEMPEGAEIVHAAEHQGSICLWAVVDPDAQTESRRFVVVGTGQEVGDGWAEHEFVGTAMVGEFVWHVFEDTFFEGKSQRLKGLESSVDKLKKKTETIERQLEDLENRVADAALEKSLDDIRKNMDDMQTQLKKLGRRVAKAALESSVGKLEKRTQMVEIDLYDLEHRVSTIEYDLS